MWFFHDSTFLLLIPALILAIYAQSKVKSAYAKYSRIESSRGMTGSETARGILDTAGLNDVPVEETPGHLSDHYDPRSRILRLSREVFHGRSLAALGIAAHEAGHALQHQQAYAPLAVRNGIFPVASLGSTLAFPLFLFGFLFANPKLMDIGIILFSGAVLFQVITLPVEFNASRRALATLQGRQYLVGDEILGARKVLSAAALTYVAATAMAVMQLLRLVLLRGSRD